MSGHTGQLGARKLTRLTITKHGRAVAIVTPPDEAADSLRRLHGFMKGSVAGLDDIDLTLPILDEPFSTEGGKFQSWPAV
jgi:antitoxin (DNA-binding transcriptional repressor) of toxin-antitoxin stability system